MPTVANSKTRAGCKSQGWRFLFSLAVASFPSMPTLKSLKYIAISADTIAITADTIAISADTDDIGGHSLARMTDLRLSHADHEKTR